MHVLILGRHLAMLQNAIQRLTQEGYVATGYTTDAETIQALQTGAIDLVVIGGGVEVASRNQIKAVADQMTPPPQVVEVYGPQHLIEAVNATRAAKA